MVKSKHFGDILKKYIKGSTDPKNTQRQFVTAITEYFNNAFNSHINNPAWQVSGMIYIPPSATSSLMGKYGTVSSFCFKPMSPTRFKYFLNLKEGIYVGIAKAIEQMLNQSILFVDIKNAGFVTPMNCKILTSLDGFGRKWQKYMDSRKCSSMDSWYSTLNIYFEKIWDFIPGNVVFYNGVGAGMTFTGTITVTGSALKI